MRSLFPWGQGLSDADFESALLVLGLLPPSIARLSSLPETDELANDLLARRKRLGERPWAWRLRPGAQDLIRGSDDGRLLAEAGRKLVSLTLGSRFELRIEANLSAKMEPVALAKALRGAGAQSVYIRFRDEGDITWTWPLQLAVDSGSTLLDDIQQYSSLSRLYRRYEVTHLSQRVNLALFTDSLATANKRLLASRRRPGADAIVLFGGVGAPELKVASLVAKIRELSGAQAVVVLSTSDTQQAKEAVVDLITELSHDRPLDVAISLVAQNLDVPVFTWASRGLIKASTLREQGRILAHRLRKLKRRISVRQDRDRPIGADILDRPIGADDLEETADEVDISADDFFSTGAPPHVRVDARDLGDELARRLPQAMPEENEPFPQDMMTFDAESGDATTIADLARATADTITEDIIQREGRFFQARVQTPGGRVVDNEAPLRPNRDYEACVFIGAPRQRWLGLDKALDEPAPRPDGSPLTLQVMFWEPSLEKGPKLVPLKLYPEGDTAVVSFPFTTPSKVGDFWARIAVYHRNRVLQTGVLKGTVGLKPGKLTFTPDAAPLPRFVGLEDRAEVGASIIFNDDPSGATLAYIHVDGEMAVANLGNGQQPTADGPVPDVGVNPSHVGALDTLVDALGKSVTRITQNPDDYSELKKEGTRKLLFQLALHGGNLLESLQIYTGMQHKFDRVEHIQIVQAHAGAFFPIEYCYAGTLPEGDASICSCLDDPEHISSAGNCAEYDADPQHTICPLKFWSLSKVIERHTYLREHSDLEYEFILRNSPASTRERVLYPLSGAVLAASCRVDEAVPNTVDNLRDQLVHILEKPVPVAEDWDVWANHIKETSPHLLVLLPHHGRSEGFDFLEIGEGNKRETILIRDEHVRPDHSPEIRPVVLLIGCETATAKVDFESSVESFKRRGAAIIVSTIATILGRQAGPAAGAIVEELQRVQNNENATFGLAMRTVRRRLLATGTPMILGLTSYGDADWRIVSTR